MIMQGGAVHSQGNLCRRPPPEEPLGDLVPEPALPAPTEVDDADFCTGKKKKSFLHTVNYKDHGPITEYTTLSSEQCGLFFVST